MCRTLLVAGDRSIFCEKLSSCKGLIQRTSCLYVINMPMYKCNEIFLEFFFSGHKNNNICEITFKSTLVIKKKIMHNSSALYKLIRILHLYTCRVFFSPCVIFASVFLALCIFRNSLLVKGSAQFEFAKTQLCLQRNNMRHWNSPSLYFEGRKWVKIKRRQIFPYIYIYI